MNAPTLTVRQKEVEETCVGAAEALDSALDGIQVYVKPQFLMATLASLALCRDRLYACSKYVCDRDGNDRR